MAGILRDSTVFAAVVVVAVVSMRPRAIPLAMITMRKSTHRFPSVRVRGSTWRSVLANLKWRHYTENGNYSVNSNFSFFKCNYLKTMIKRCAFWEQSLSSHTLLHFQHTAWYQYVNYGRDFLHSSRGHVWLANSNIPDVLEFYRAGNPISKLQIFFKSLATSKFRPNNTNSS